MYYSEPEHLTSKATAKMFNVLVFQKRIILNIAKLINTNAYA